MEQLPNILKFIPWILLILSLVYSYIKRKQIIEKGRQNRKDSIRVSQSLKRILAMPDVVRAAIFIAKPPPSTSVLVSTGSTIFEEFRPDKDPVFEIWQAVRLDRNYMDMLIKLQEHEKQFINMENTSEVLTALYTSQKVIESAVYLIYKDAKIMKYLSVNFDGTTAEPTPETERNAIILLQVNLLRNIFNKNKNL